MPILLLQTRQIMKMKQATTISLKTTLEDEEDFVVHVHVLVVSVSSSDSSFPILYVRIQYRRELMAANNCLLLLLELLSLSIPYPGTGTSNK